MALLFQLSSYAHYAHFATHRPHPQLSHDIEVGVISVSTTVVLPISRARPVHYAGLIGLISLVLWDRARYAIN